MKEPGWIRVKAGTSLVDFIRDVETDSFHDKVQVTHAPALLHFDHTHFHLPAYPPFTCWSFTCRTFTHKIYTARLPHTMASLTAAAHAHGPSRALFPHGRRTCSQPLTCCPPSRPSHILTAPWNAHTCFPSSLHSHMLPRQSR